MRSLTMFGMVGLTALALASPVLAQDAVVNVGLLDMTAVVSGPGAAGFGNGPQPGRGFGMMGGGYGMMGGGGYGPGMMGAGAGGPWGSGWHLGQAGQAVPPGSPGFVAGTGDAPRVVQVTAGPGLTFTPDDIPVEAGETITFEITTVGPATHEFKVGPLAEVIADSDAAPEIAGIGMMQTRSLTYTFSGPGPYGFACHEPGHFEGGMRGTVTIVG